MCNCGAPKKKIDGELKKTTVVQPPPPTQNNVQLQSNPAPKKKPLYYRG